MNREQIDDVICEIMSFDGPDGHVDGHETITKFIIAIQKGRADKWLAAYRKSKQPKRRKKYNPENDWCPQLKAHLMELQESSNATIRPAGFLDYLLKKQ